MSSPKSDKQSKAAGELLAADMCSTTVESFKKSILHHVMSFQGRDPERAGKSDIYKALAYTIRDIMTKKWIDTQKAYYEKEKKRVYYLSLEFLIGRSLSNAIINLGVHEQVKEAVEELGYDLTILAEEEEDAALGNGGLGRLAALSYPNRQGYGLRW